MTRRPRARYRLAGWLLGLAAIAWSAACNPEAAPCADVPGAGNDCTGPGADAGPGDTAGADTPRAGDTLADGGPGDAQAPDAPAGDGLLGDSAAPDGRVADAPEGDTAPVPPTYWSAAATRTVDDLVFVKGAGTPIFAIGVHPSRTGAWDGITGPGGCHEDPETGRFVGTTNDGKEQLHKAVAAGANFVFLWGYGSEPDYIPTDPRPYGRWYPGYGSERPVEQDVTPILVNEHGETDMEGYSPTRLAELSADFEAFRTRTGRWAPENAPNLPPYEDMPYFAWHPTFRMKGGGDGSGETFTDAEVEDYARATNMMIGDTYSYVCNRWDSRLNWLTGQVGETGECYDDWLSRDDPEHRGYFSAAWDLAYSLRRHANPDAVVWMWMQGHAFDDDIGGGECWNGESDLWANGPFPTLRYLRKEIASTIAAGGTGIIFFGYGYNREATAEKVRSLIRALAFDEVYGPALLSPRLDLGQDTAFLGPEGRAHVIVKWDAAGRRAFVIGANPGGQRTRFSLEFPWTLAGVERLDWNTPKFIAAADATLADRRLTYVAPEDEGFVLRVTPLFE